MGTERYFASEEAEKAAKWDMFQNLKQSKSHLAVLRDRAEKIGKALESFGIVLANPSWKFTVTEHEIVGRTTLLATAEPLIVPRAYLNSEATANLIREIEETEKRVDMQSKAVAEIGYSLQ